MEIGGDLVAAGEHGGAVFGFGVGDDLTGLLGDSSNLLSLLANCAGPAVMMILMVRIALCRQRCHSYTRWVDHYCCSHAMVLAMC